MEIKLYGLLFVVWVVVFFLRKGKFETETIKNVDRRTFFQFYIKRYCSFDRKSTSNVVVVVCSCYMFSVYIINVGILRLL